jgi:NAD(P)-dependent dehydrogenase (short-subunit alcohol dehydrogenase family)
MPDDAGPDTARRIALVTGTSSGIGAAVARELLDRGWEVVGIARRSGAMEGPGYTHVSLDLAEVGAIAERLDADVGPLLTEGDVTRIGLVNNAADLGILGPVQETDPDALLRVHAVNAVAPAQLMAWVTSRAQTGVPVRILNVSTGAATTPIPGAGAYCATKAALRMTGQVFAAEQNGGEGHPDATVLSYSPGTVDTPMQEEARTTSEDVLPAVDMFKRFHDEGHLVPPEAPAKEIADYLESDPEEPFAERRPGE